MNRFQKRVEKVKVLNLVRKIYKIKGLEGLNLLDECISQVRYEVERKYRREIKKTYNGVGDND